MAVLSWLFTILLTGSLGMASTLLFGLALRLFFLLARFPLLANFFELCESRLISLVPELRQLRHARDPAAWSALAR